MPFASRSIRLSRHLLILAAILVSTQAASAQSLTFGEISGSVTGPGGVPVATVEVSVVERTSGATRWVMAGRDGRFAFRVLAAGRYDVSAEALGYRPVVMTNVAIAAGHRASIAIVLESAKPPVVAVDTVRVSNPASRALSWLFDRGYADLLGARRSLGDAALLSTTADESGLEGLPWRMADVVVDGVRSSSFGASGSDGAEMAGGAFPLRGLTNASAGGTGFDVEAGGAGVGFRALSLRGGRASELRGGVEGGSANYGAVVLAGGPLQGDTAQAVVGVEYRRSEITRESVFGQTTSLGADYAAAVSALSGADIGAYTRPAERVTERWSGFGRLDFQPGDRFAVSMRGSGSRLNSTGLLEPDGLAARLGTDQVSVMAQGGVNVYARLTPRFTQELRVSADLASTKADRPTMSRTVLAGAGLTIGGGAQEPFDDSRLTPRVAAILHADLGAHQLKAGVEVASHRFDAAQAQGIGGEFRFGDAVDLGAGAGAWRSVEAGAPAGQFSMSEQAIFVQDAWEIASGLSLSLGARFDGTRIPAGEIEHNADWMAVSGIDNSRVDANRSGFSPRLGLRWELGREREWVLEGGLGVFRALPDSRDVAEALSFDRSTPVRYGAGTLGAWPAAPSLSLAPEVGRTVTVLGPDFEGPRTRRMALGVSTQRGAWTYFVSGVYRQTDYLARRRDLNLPATTGSDQHGRPLYGQLRQVGSLLAVVPASNRRFTQFDAVNVLESTGYSEFWATTAGLERVRASGLSLALSYTFSRTTDNVPGLGAGAVLPSFPQGLGGADWADGISDRDVPHRLLAAVDWSTSPTSALRLGAVYRLQSGAAFTPGVRDGVDANGDGAWGNDPAFVDGSLPGMDVVLAKHSCVGVSSGSFMERNSCRFELSQRVDLRASFRLAQLQAGRLELVLDALDVIGEARGRVDNALLLVDRAGALATNASTGVTTIPYIVNPNFGQLMADRSPGVLWRVGLRVAP